MKNDLRTRLFLATASIGLSLLLAEAVVRWVSPQNLSGSWRVMTPSNLIVNRSEGTARHQLGDRVVRYTFFPPHLRDTPLPADGARVLAVGDSFTFGWLLDWKDTYLAKLQERTDARFGHGRFRFLNGGAGGWGAADYVAFVEEIGPALDPDVVLVFINTDDIGRSIKGDLYSLEEAGGRVQAIREPRSVTRLRLKGPANALPGYQWAIEHIHLVQLLRNAAILTTEMGRVPGIDVADGPTSRRSDLPSKYAASLGQALFARLSAWCEEHGARLLVTTTGWHRDTIPETEPTRAFMLTAPAFFEERGIPFVDVSDRVGRARDAAPDGLRIRGDGHPNEHGASLIAESVWDGLLERTLAQYCREGLGCATSRIAKWTSEPHRAGENSAGEVRPYAR